MERKETKTLYAETRTKRRLRPGAQGRKLRTVHSLAECSQANFPPLSEPQFPPL